MTNTLALIPIISMRVKDAHDRSVMKISTGAALAPCIAAALALASADPAAAQASRDFQLPSPTPSPTSTAEPQGPADERAGVPIGPRVIRPRPADDPTAAPTSPPAPTATATPAAPVASTPTATPTPTPTPGPTRNPNPQRPQTGTAAPADSRSEPSRNSIEPGSGAQVPLDEITGPGFEGTVDTEIPPEELNEPVGPDDWYAIEPEDGRSTQARNTEITSGISDATLGALAVRQTRLIAGIAIMLVLAAVLAFVVWRRRRTAEPVHDNDGPSLARGVSRVIDRQMSTPVADIAQGREDSAAQPATQTADTQAVSQPADEVAGSSIPEPSSPDGDLPDARVDLDLDIIGATRSLMMLTLEFRVEVANRSDRAVRDLSVSGKLSSAQRGGANAAPVAKGQPIGEIARLGPNQKRSITAQLQLPLSQVQPILQGNKPLLIPLLHLTLGGQRCKARNYSYVIGNPSLAGSGRVHPIPLDGTPGGLSGLQAQLINNFEAGAQAGTI